LRDRLRRLSRKYLTGRRVSPKVLKHMQEGLLEESTPDLDYIVLTVGACVIATFGLLSNSTAVIIGAMIVAPLMLPIRGIAFGILEGETELLITGFKALVFGTFVAISLSGTMGLMVGLPEYGSEVAARSEPTLLDLGIAVVAGSISVFAKVEPKLSSTLAGTAIAVALMPPVCVIGLGLAQGNEALWLGASLLYITNLIGITLACMVTFVIAGYANLGRTRNALGITLAFTGLLLIPLGINLFELVRQNRLEASLKVALLDKTITFQQVDLVGSKTNWLVEPPEVRLAVRAQEPVTPKQVQLLEAFVAREMKRPFTLIFEVSQLQEVRGNELEEEIER